MKRIVLELVVTDRVADDINGSITYDTPMMGFSVDSALYSKLVSMDNCESPIVVELSDPREAIEYDTIDLAKKAIWEAAKVGRFARMIVTHKEYASVG